MSADPEKDKERRELAELVKRAQKGDISAIDEIYRKLCAAVFSYVLRRVGNRQDAEDITSLVFERVFRYINHYVARGYSFKSWVYRIARNAIADHFRRLGTHPCDPVPEVPPPPEDKEFDETIADLVCNNEFWKIASRLLPQRKMHVLVLREVEEMSYAEIAEELDVKEGAARKAHLDALRVLKRYEVLLLARVRGLTVEEIAARMNRSEEEVRDILNRQLRGMDERGDES